MQDEKLIKKMRKRSLVGLQVYQKLFNSSNGKKIIWDLMKHSGFMDSPKGKIDANDVIFREGQKDIVRYILMKLKMDYKQLEKLIDGGLNDDATTYE